MVNDCSDFVKRAKAAVDECEIDALCIEWIELALSENGREGEIGLKLMKCVKELMP